jgi:hypothetical protein
VHSLHMRVPKPLSARPLQLCLSRSGTRVQGALRGVGFADALGSEVFRGTVSDHETPLLRALVLGANRLPGPIVEIGTLFGLTTIKLALWKAPGQAVITVDDYSWNPWGLAREAHRDLTTRILEYVVATGHVQQVEADKECFYETYSGPPPSLVFLDAVHDYENTRLDILWARRVRARIISGHDYANQFPGVQQSVNEAGGPRALCGSLWTLDSEALRDEGLPGQASAIRL